MVMEAGEIWQGCVMGNEGALSDSKMLVYLVEGLEEREIVMDDLSLMEVSSDSYCQAS